MQPKTTTNYQPNKQKDSKFTIPKFFHNRVKFNNLKFQQNQESKTTKL